MPTRAGTSAGNLRRASTLGISFEVQAQVMRAVHAGAAVGRPSGQIWRAVWPALAVTSVVVALVVAVMLLERYFGECALDVGHNPARAIQKELHVASISHLTGVNQGHFNVVPGKESPDQGSPCVTRGCHRPAISHTALEAGVSSISRWK
jgi:hypothetical protein